MYAIAFQRDGALACSARLDAIGRGVGFKIRQDYNGFRWTCQGHFSNRLSSQTATRLRLDPTTIQCGYGTCGSSNLPYTIAAHSSTVSDLAFFRSSTNSFPLTLPQKLPQRPQTNGHAEPNGVKPEDLDTKPIDIEPLSYPEAPLDGIYLATSGYDGQVKFWSSDDWQLVKSIFI